MEGFIIKSFIYICLILIPIGIFFIGKDKLNKYNQKSSYSDEYMKVSTTPIFSYSSIPEDVKEKMLGLSMPKDVPINFNELSYLTLSYYSFDGNTYIGEMIVNKEVASEVVDIFKEIYEKKYTIDKIKLIDEYNAVDELSMNNNNSSSFCYRTIKNTDIVSNHGKGLAIDINPIQNPHVVGDDINPKNGSNFKDRTNIKQGMITEGDDLYNAFIKRGWSWGGHWKNPDYQHFEKKLD